MTACPGADSVLGHNISIDRGSIWCYPTSKIRKHTKTRVVRIEELIKDDSSTVGLNLNIILAKTGKWGDPLNVRREKYRGDRKYEI